MFIIYAYVNSHRYIYLHRVIHKLGFPGVSDGKESACNVEDSGSIPGLLKRFPGEENGNLLHYSFFFFSFQYSCLENSINRGAWWATAYGVTKGWTQLGI